MPEAAVKGVSLVEKGWAAARQASIALAKSGIPVRHWVKGKLSRNLLDVLTPYPGIKITGVAPWIYRVVTGMVLAASLCRGKRLKILVDNERTRQWVSRCFPALKDSVILVLENADGSPRLLDAAAVK